jgi:aminoglycoside phosphotransferase family enzyme
VYLDTVPLRVDTTGNLRLGGEGRILDWLVQMRRLPRESMLDWAIQTRTARKIDIEKIALRLAQFYQQSLPVELTPVAYRAQLQEEVRANRRELLQLAVGLPVDTVRAIAADQLAFIADHPDLFDERVRTGRIVEGHGDLRPEHICLAPEPAIIDCLEFKREFRILDAADELAFLALECERLGAPWIGDRVLATYSGVTNDKPPEALVEFYKSYRAYLRAKIAIWHQREPGMANSGKWVARAQTYLDLARQHVPRGA